MLKYATVFFREIKDPSLVDQKCSQVDGPWLTRPQIASAACGSVNMDFILGYFNSKMGCESLVQPLIRV